MRFYGIDPERERPRVQALRAAPPGWVTRDDERRAVFGASLEQFDELWLSAGNVGPPVSPIPLFYALSQAGRAIAAAQVEDTTWSPSGHGLSVGAAGQPLGETLVEPHKKAHGSQFAVFCRAIGSTPLTSDVRLSDVWASIPQLERVPGLGAEALPVLSLGAIGPTHGFFWSARIEGPVVANLAADRDEAARVVSERLDAYPGAGEGVLIQGEFPTQGTGDDPEPVEVAWKTRDGTLRSIDQVSSGLGPPDAGFYVWPGLGANRDVLAPLASWWIVLLALSSIARYEPARWVAALDRDHSHLAIPIEEALAIAREMLPWFVLHALRGELEPPPTARSATGRIPLSD